MDILAVVGQSLVIYVFLVITLCRVGPALMAGMTSFNYLVVALLGSAVETGLYRGSNSLSAGLASAATLILADRATSALMCRWPRLRRLLAGGPVVLVHDGRVIPAHLRSARMTEEDVRAAVRRHGYDDLAAVRLAVLEPSGRVGVVPKDG
ncbi:MAG TPA: YetF domain-containing protein [Gemmataceae bacterium]